MEFDLALSGEKDRRFRPLQDTGNQSGGVGLSPPTTLVLNGSASGRDKTRRAGARWASLFPVLAGGHLGGRLVESGEGEAGESWRGIRRPDQAGAGHAPYRAGVRRGRDGDANESLAVAHLGW